LDFSLDYKLTTDTTYTTLNSTANQVSYTVNGLIMGSLYNFKVRSLNIVGPSIDSLIATFMAAQVPIAPAAPTKLNAD
jgi:hypothetical protein